MFISGAIHEVERSLLIAVIGVIAIIFLFLLDWRATIIPAISIPVALIGTVAGIYAFGFSLNILTLLALVIATGLVVDDAIVVLENIMRRRSMGLGPRAAAVLGTQEVFFAVMATTLTLAAVFVPLSFLPGQTGQLFREFGFALAIAVLLSAVVALSLAPMLASRLLKPHAERPPNVIQRFGRLLGGLYRRTLHVALDNPLVVVLIAVLFAGAAWGVFGTLRQELTPAEDRALIGIRISAPATVSYDFTRTQMQTIEQLVAPYRDSGEVESIYSVSGFGNSTNSGFLMLRRRPGRTASAARPRSPPRSTSCWSPSPACAPAPCSPTASVSAAAATGCASPSWATTTRCWRGRPTPSRRRWRRTTNGAASR